MLTGQDLTLATTFFESYQVCESSAEEGLLAPPTDAVIASPARTRSSARSVARPSKSDL